MKICSFVSEMFEGKVIIFLEIKISQLTMLKMWQRFPFLSIPWINSPGVWLFLNNYFKRRLATGKKVNGLFGFYVFFFVAGFSAYTFSLLVSTFYFQSK